MEEALVARLLASASLAAIFGTRIFWDDLPQSTTYPALRLTNITPGRDYTHDGHDGLSDPLVQFDSFGRSKGEATRGARALIATLEQTATQGSIKFGMSFLDGERTLPTVSLSGGQRIFGLSLDFRIFYEEQ